jgi:hypothetical protein
LLHPDSFEGFGGWKVDHKFNEDEHALLSDLQRGGIPLDEEALERIRTASRGLSMYQTGTILETSVFDLDSGGSGYMLSVAIHNDSTRPIRLHEIRLEMLWHDAAFRWLDDPRRASPRKYTYSFPPSESLEFERDVVLNHYIGGAGQLNPGASIEGLLLGMGESPIPDEYRDRQLLPMRLLVLDRGGRQYASHLKLHVSRRSRNRIEKGPRQPLRSEATRK